MIRKLRKRFIRIAVLSVAAVMLVLTLIVNIANYVSVNSDLTEMLTIIYENQGKIPSHIGSRTAKTDTANEKTESASDTNADSAPQPEAAADTETQSTTAANNTKKAAPEGKNTESSSTGSNAHNTAAKKSSTGTTDTAASDTGSSDSGSSATEPSDASKKTSASTNRIGSGPFNPETPYSTRYFVLRFDSEGTVSSSNLTHIAAVTKEETREYAKLAAEQGAGLHYCGDYKCYVVKQGSKRYVAIFLDCYQELRSVKLVALWSLLADIFCILLVYLLVTIFSNKAIEPAIRTMEQQKQFITDAGHELKTPLTVINTSLSVLEMEVGSQKWIDKAKAQTIKMGELINALVSLSRFDEETPSVQKAEFCISDAITDVAESFRETAEQKGHPLQTEIIPELRYYGDEAAIRQLAGILLDNAVKYTSDDGVITLSLRRDRHTIILQESNPCPPMNEETCRRLFNRFYRPDASRNSATGGFGVGLSIARSITEAHDGQIQASYTADGQLRFTAALKITAASK